MARTVTVIILALLLVPAAARPDFGLTEEQARRLIDDNNSLKAQFDACAKQLDDLRDQIIKLQQREQVMREELVRKGVDVEQLLSPPPATQSDMPNPALIFESPEAMGEYLRENFSQRVRDDMTQFQREAAMADFNTWINSAALLPTQVTWVFKVVDIWRAMTPEQVRLDYFSDRMPLVAKLTKLDRSLEELEMLELNLERIKAEQKAGKDRLDLRTREFADASPTHKQLAELVMKQTREQLVAINVRVRAVEASFSAKKMNTPKLPRAATQGDHGGYRIMMHARGARDDTIDLNVFCNERDANRLMAAPKGSLVKVRGWISDIAMAERLATLGYRIDHAEVLAVNVETPPPPAALPVAPADRKPGATPPSPDDRQPAAATPPVSIDLKPDSAPASQPDGAGVSTK